MKGDLILAGLLYVLVLVVWAALVLVGVLAVGYVAHIGWDLADQL